MRLLNRQRAATVCDCPYCYPGNLSNGNQSYLPAKQREGTNNQVDGVDEADVVKSDGKYVYAAYGDVLFVWNATDASAGMSVTKMPQESYENCTRDNPIKPWKPEPFPGVSIIFRTELAWKISRQYLNDTTPFFLSARAAPRRSRFRKCATSQDSHGASSQSSSAKTQSPGAIHSSWLALQSMYKATDLIAPSS